MHELIYRVIREFAAKLLSLYWYSQQQI